MELFLTQLHFLRPTWFLGFVPLILFSYSLIKSHKMSRSWQTIIDPKLLPHLLVGKASKHSSLPSIIYFIIGTLVIISLAGPVWQKRPQPVFKEQSALVIALDLSRSMDAGDIKPSRLTRARHKITDILNQRKLGQTALIVYAAGAYTVSPLTDDTATITSLLPSLTTDLMPSQGTRTDKALQTAASLFENSGISKGDILLVTDSIEAKAATSFTTISKAHRISILAIATTTGAPIPQANGGFVKDRRGNIVVPTLNTNNFRKFSNIGTGQFSVITTDDADITQITSLFDNNRFNAKKKSKTSTLQTDSWYEQGPWLLLIIIPLASLIFRRGILFTLAIAIVMLQQPQTVEAASLWDSLWSTNDQRASKLLEQGNSKEAAELFDNNQWQAASHFKNKQYQQSIDSLQDINTAEAHYNKGNAYAQLGNNQKAIEEYDEAIKLDPDHKDAMFNKNIINKKKDQDKNKEQQKNKNDSGKDSKKSKDGKPQEGDDSKGKKDNDSQNQDEPGKNDKSQDSKNNQQESKPADNEKSNDKPNEDKENLKKESKEKNKNKNKNEDEDEDEKNAAKPLADNEDTNQKDKITKQWLRRIPDDPGGLLRNKFNYQYKRQQQQQSEEENW